MDDVKVCVECRGLCQPLVVKDKMEASEWYCPKCHKSYPMFERRGAEGDIVPAR